MTVSKSGHKGSSIELVELLSLLLILFFSLLKSVKLCQLTAIGTIRKVQTLCVGLKLDEREIFNLFTSRNV